jgi:type IX secretion system PorP/SprF family membrane protein
MKNIFKNSVLVLILAIGFESFAQQDPLYTQYYNNFSLINPAYAGSHGLFTATANIRSQWAGEAGGPETQTLSLHGPVGKNVGLGLSIVNDKVFVLSETHVYADFSYSIYPSEYSTLAFGLKVGGSFLDVNLLELGIENDNLFSENLNEFNPNIGAGAFYYTNRFYASVSTVNILQTKHYNKSNAVVSSASDEMIFYLSSGYVFDLSDDFKIRPSVMLRVVNGSPLSTDISTSVLWLDKLEFGISHRINESISGLFQLRLTDNLKVGYTYDAITSNLSNYNNGSHEFSIILNIGKNKNTRKPPFYWMKNKNF